MELRTTSAGVVVPSLLSMLADGGGRHATLAVLHHRALQVTGGTCSLLFEPHPANGHMHVTSGAGIDALPIDPRRPTGAEAALLATIFADRVAAPAGRVAEEMPQLHLLSTHRSRATQ